MTTTDDELAAAVLAGAVGLGDDAEPPDHVQAAFAAMQAESRQALREGRPQPTLTAPRVTVEPIPGVVIRPGDRLLLSIPAALTDEQAADVKARVIDRLPDLADVIVLGGGVSVAGVYRTEES